MNIKDKNIILITSIVWMIILGIYLSYIDNKNETKNTKYIEEKVEIESIKNAIQKSLNEEQVFLIDINFVPNDVKSDARIQFFGHYVTSCSKSIMVRGFFNKDKDIRFEDLVSSNIRENRVYKSK